MPQKKVIPPEAGYPGLPINDAEPESKKAWAFFNDEVRPRREFMSDLVSSTETSRHFLTKAALPRHAFVRRHVSHSVVPRARCNCHSQFVCSPKIVVPITLRLLFLFTSGREWRVEENGIRQTRCVHGSNQP